jgi:hypothetical protein
MLDFERNMEGESMTLRRIESKGAKQGKKDLLQIINDIAVCKR